MSQPVGAKGASAVTRGTPPAYAAQELPDDEALQTVHRASRQCIGSTFCKPLSLLSGRLIPSKRVLPFRHSPSTPDSNFKLCGIQVRSHLKHERFLCLPQYVLDSQDKRGKQTMLSTHPDCSRPILVAATRALVVCIRPTMVRPQGPWQWGMRNLKTS